MNSELREELKLIKSASAKECWTNLATDWQRGDNGELVRPQTVFLGSIGDNQFGAKPTWEEPVLDIALYKKNSIALKSGNISDKYAVIEDPYIGRFADIAKEYADKVSAYFKSGSKASLKSAGVGMTGDYSTIDIVNVANEMVNTELRAFSLEDAVTTVATPQLTLRFDTFTRFTGDKNIGELVPPVFKLGSVARTTLDLPKDGSATALSFEAQTRAVRDVFRANIDNAVTDLKRIKANKIATEIETAADVSAGDWAGITSDHYTRSALDDIGTVTDTIVSNNGQADTIACHDRVARDLISNLGASAISFIGKAENTMQNLGGVTSVARSFVIPSTNMTVYVDNEKTNTLASVYEKKSIWKLQGPVRTAVWRDEAADYDAFRVFDFNLPKLIIAGRARDLTGVSA
jgi:hypothetical protein